MRQSLIRVGLIFCIFFGVQGYSQLSNPGRLAVDGIVVNIPADWNIFQQVQENETGIINFSLADGFVTLYSKSGDVDLTANLASDANVLRTALAVRAGEFQWKMTEIQSGENFSVIFSTNIDGRSYFGSVLAKSQARSKEIADLFLAQIERKPRLATRSLTGPDFTGKKYYLGWGAAMTFDPAMMHNEVKYDVQHTHDIFTNDIGGGYIGAKLIGPQVKKADITAEWNKIAANMTSNDMFIQYSSGHGSTTGLAVGVTYNDIRDNALKMPAQEIIIFTMACLSGNLVDSFNNKKDVWGNWQAQGRTLMVMGSSKSNENSSTGPGKDPGQPGGPSGSAGSAFGHALWKALVGNADGAVDGVKDGLLSLGEISTFTIKKTLQVGGHTPVVTGAYNPTLVMARVPSREFVQSLEGGSESLSDDQIMEKIRQLDSAMRVGHSSSN